MAMTPYGAWLIEKKDRKYKRGRERKRDRETERDSECDGEIRERGREER